MQRPCESWRNWKKACVLDLGERRSEWQEMSLGKGHELGQILVFVLRAVGSLERILSRNDMKKKIFLLKRSLLLQCGQCFGGGILAVRDSSFRMLPQWSSLEMMVLEVGWW